jgi:N-acetylneuraminic acid mutarotase
MKNLNRLFLLLLLAPVVYSFYGCEESNVYGDWIKLSDFGGPGRGDASAFVIGTKGYVFGGYTGKYYLSDIWVYDSESDTWTQGQDFPGEKRCSATAFALDGKGYVGLGYNGENDLDDFWMYDPAADSWTQKASFTEGGRREGAIAFGLNGYGYMGTGYDVYNSYYLADMYKYDPIADTWTPFGSVPGEKRAYGTTFIHNNEAYVIGGVSGTGAAIYTFCKFNPTTSKWVTLNQIDDNTDNAWDDHYSNIGRQHPLCFVIGEKAYITGGASSTNSLLSTTWEYVFKDDRWDEATACEATARTAAVAFNFGNRGMILTGRSGSYRLSDVWEFLPDAIYSTRSTLQ